MKYSWKLVKGKNSIAHISDGNRKLISSIICRFLIWNLPCRITCPFATKHCLDACYARKAEAVYPDATPSRIKNLKFSHMPIFVTFMIAIIHYICGLKAYKQAEVIIFRIHESGDFYNKAYAEKWKSISESCKDIANLRFMAYSKSIEFFKDGIPENMVIRASIWDDTDEKQLELIRKLDLPTYTVITDKKAWESLPEEEKCYCADCGQCRKCFDKDHKHIYCLKH